MGRPLGSKNKNKVSIKERLYSKIIINQNGCWEMEPYKGHRYPALQVGRKIVRANRLSYELHNNKKIPKNKCCLHTCDNTKCINPEHLFIGTHKQNMRDMIKKGRDKKDPPSGSRCAQHKLIEDQVLIIRLLLKDVRGRKNIADKYREIANIYNVSIHTIYSLNKRITWKHI
jgi:hypothetical protein